MNINNFVSNFQGGARANLYRVTITSMPDKLKFIAKATALPGKDLGTIEVRYLNHVIPYRGDVTMQDWHTTILLDQDWAVRNEIESWWEKIQSSSEITGSSSLLDYTETALIEQLDSTGGVIAGYTMYHIWPFSIPATELAFDSADTISEMDVQFKLSYWEKK